MSLIESGKLIKVTLTIKVPAGMPAEVDLVAWAVSQIHTSLSIQPLMLPVEFQIGQINPGPALVP